MYCLPEPMKKHMNGVWTVLKNVIFDGMMHSVLFYRRQFDNVKRVFKVVEDMQGSVVQNIKTNFLLPEELAR
jgi:hypothetical protein